DALDAHRDDIRRIYGLGITEGTSETTFSPLMPVSPQQAASFLARLFKAVEGEAPPPVEAPFMDLGDALDAHRDDIRRIYGLGILAGVQVTTLSPDACVARGAMATLLSRFHAVVTASLVPMVETPFTDLDGRVTAPSGDIGRVYGLGITEGTSPTTFSPDACTTRQQMASFLARAYRALTTTLLSALSAHTGGSGAPE
ncbi:MAG: S-layer homology domain-containing protein, partial [Acidimicrobiia bacterium]|nr:S-layer homology domain-containing protein [Acidimicrobiia bacterium]